VVRVLDLSNVELVETDITRLQGDIGFIVSRATLPPEKASHLFERLLSRPGTAVLGGSWTREPQYPGWKTVDVGGEVLDQPVWLLIMRR
jgi:16S rRNA G527 N7-methylase RsmG